LTHGAKYNETTCFFVQKIFLYQLYLNSEKDFYTVNKDLRTFFSQSFTDIDIALDKLYGGLRMSGQRNRDRLMKILGNEFLNYIDSIKNETGGFPPFGLPDYKLQRYLYLKSG